MSVEYVVFGDNGTTYLSDGVDVMAFTNLQKCVEAARDALVIGLPLAYFGREIIEGASFAAPPMDGSEDVRHQWLPLKALELPESVHGTWKIVHDFLGLYTGRAMENFYRPPELPRIRRSG